MTPHKTVTMIEVPEAILKPCHESVRARRSVEYRIVHRVVSDLLAAGFALWIDHEGEERYDITSADQEPMAELFACDEERLYVAKDGKRAGWVMFVYGNDGWDVVSDYTTNLEPHMQGATEFANQCQ